MNQISSKSVEERDVYRLLESSVMVRRTNGGKDRWTVVLLYPRRNFVSEEKRYRKLFALFFQRPSCGIYFLVKFPRRQACNTSLCSEFLQDAFCGKKKQIEKYIF